MPEKTLTPIDHIALQVNDIDKAVNWYQQEFHCDVLYQDKTWALLQFANIKLALVIPHEHPAHIAFRHPHAEKKGKTKTRRDGEQSVYTTDPFDNAIEWVQGDPSFN